MTTSIETGAPYASARSRGLAPQDLELFVGDWATEGEQLESTMGRSDRIAAREHFEWLIGGKFLVHRFEGMLGTSPIACVEMIEHDASPPGHRVHTFYSDGHVQTWLLAPRYGEWIITADWQLADGSKRKVRSISRFDDAATTRTAVWESSRDGRDWEPFWRVTSRRIGK